MYLRNEARPGAQLTVPVHRGRDLLSGTLSAILDQAGLTVEELRRLMCYTVILEPDPEGRGYTVRVPVLPGCTTEGETRDEALANAREAIEGFIEGLNKAGEPVPEEKHSAELATVTIG